MDLTDTATCYRVVTTNYVSGLFGFVSSASGGLLSVDAKDADCTTLVDPTTRYVDAEPAMAGVQELEHWQALYGYVSCFPNADADGISGRAERLYGGPRAHRPTVSERRRVPRRLDFLVCTITCNTEGANRSEPKRCEPKRASWEITLIDSRQCR